MHLSRNIALVAIFLSGLVACSGSEDYPTFEEQANAYDDMSGRADTLADTTVGQMPTGGQATYTGVVSARVLNATITDLYAGDATITADFDAATIEGGFSNFNVRDPDRNLARAGGSLALSNGTITGASVSADVTGTLSHGGDTLVFDGDLEGGFMGPGAEMLNGEIDADVVVNGTENATWRPFFFTEQ